MEGRQGETVRGLRGGDWGMVKVKVKVKLKSLPKEHVSVIQQCTIYQAGE